MIRVTASGRQWGKPVAFGLTVVLVGIALYEVAFLLMLVGDWSSFGVDFHLYQTRARGFIEGEGFYLPYQMAGPYMVSTENAPTLYPPIVLYLLVPFALLPIDLLWWVVPFGVIALSLYRLRPPMWAWPILAAILAYPRTWVMVFNGNPALWVMAALLAGFVWTWPWAFVPVKLIHAPWALLGVRRRTFWKGVGVLALLALPFGTMWLDYALSVLNARNNMGLAYLVGEVPIALALVVVGMGSTLDLRLRRPERDRQSTGVPTPATVGGHGHGNRTD
jgi:hypothetical protein